MPDITPGDFRLDAVVIGAQKAATSSLFRALCEHPDVSGCAPKEPHHFIRGDWREGMPEYARHFPSPHGRLTLEASTTYSFGRHSESVADRLQRHNPAMRIVHVVRHPVDRIVSAHRHALSRGYQIPSRLEAALERWPGLLDNTRYASRLRPFRERFGARNILVLTFEDVSHSQPETAVRTWEFLGLAPRRGATFAENLSSAPKLHHAHDGNRLMEAFARRAPRIYERLAKGAVAADSSLGEETRAAIRYELRPEVATLERWTGRDLSQWRF